MNLRDAREYQKNPRKTPKDIILATNEPLALNQVLLYGRWRVRVTKVLTETEFRRQLAHNLAQPNHAVGEAPIAGNKAVLEESIDILSPAEEFTFYYAAAILPGPPVEETPLRPWSKSS